jgi:hypothetical protein
VFRYPAPLLGRQDRGGLAELREVRQPRLAATASRCARTGFYGFKSDCLPSTAATTT